jgi:hypothetical protein
MDWLASCVKEHPGCAKLDGVFVPPRLLHVKCDQDEVHLVDMDVTKPVPYAVLSYCWGGDQVFKTTKSNAGTVSRAMKDLPQTIKDAVLVTRQVKLEYLWVDSMCIIQDSEEDTSALLSQMHRIYECAQVTIAASKASRCTEGFLAPRSNITQFYLPIRYFPGINKPEKVGRVILIPSQHRPIEPIVTRAWTLQECLLSRRILSYGSQQLRWYCKKKEYCDGGVMNDNSANYTAFLPLERRRTLYLHLKRKSPRKDLTSIPWIDLVEQYTMREMSESSDKLIAISAVAQRLVSVTEGKWGRYYAGVWEERFFEQLLWTMHTDKIAKRPAEYRAPSWSWAAVNGKLKWPLIKHLLDATISCKLLHVEIQPLRSDQPFGAVTSGRIKILGKVKQALWSADRRTIRDSKTKAVVTNEPHMQTFPDALEDDPQEMTIHVLEVARHGSLVDTMEMSNIKRCGPYEGNYVAGILLEHISDNVYQRIGFIRLRSPESKTKPSSSRWHLLNKQWWSEEFTTKEITII